MAEGFVRHLGKALFEVHSAGSIAAGVNPKAVAVMREVGIDISNQRSKVLDGKMLNNIDVVITLCSDIEDACPPAPLEMRVLHWPIEDPVGFVGTEQETMKAFRKARDEIRKKIEHLIETLSLTSLDALQ